MNGDFTSTDPAWGGLSFTIPVASFPVTPAPQLRGIVKLGAVAEMTVPLHDEVDERQRIERMAEKLKQHVREIGYALSTATMEWRRNGEDPAIGGHATAVLIIKLSRNSREDRRAVLLDLLGFLADQDDEAVRERLAVRVR